MKKDENKIQDQKKLKKQLAFLVLGFFLIAGVSASYLFQISANEITGSVIGGNSDQLIITNNFQNFELNTSNSSDTNNQVFSFWNPNGAVLMDIDLNISKEFANDGCLNPQEDVEVVLYNSTNGEVLNGSQIFIQPGVNNFYLNSSAVYKSCEQNISVTFELTEFYN